MKYSLFVFTALAVGLAGFVVTGSLSASAGTNLEKNGTVLAKKKRCKKGYAWDSDIRKCVVVRGSY